jgi:hypothetical protein
MRMSWINRHWDQEYITSAETKIKQTVSLLFRSALEMFSITSLKMLEYHEKVPAQPVQTSESDAGDPGAEEMPKYTSLVAKYGLDDMDIGESEGNEQTIEQEYQAYIMAPLSSKTVNILKFWEVGDFVNDISMLLMGRCRLTKCPSPLFS